MPEWYTFRPIDTWPGKLTINRERSSFATSWTKTQALLRREIEMLQTNSWDGIYAAHVVMQIAVTELDFRVDGGLRAQSKPTHPGIVVAFDSRHGPLKYATDKFRDWQDNVRAIALALESLRRVDRYGVSTRGEQYTGYMALPPAADDMTPAEAREFLVHEGGYRAAVMRYHTDTGMRPDVHMFARVTAAKAIVDRAKLTVP